MFSAEEYKSRIGSDVKRRFVQAKVFFVHKGFENRLYRIVPKLTIAFTLRGLLPYILTASKEQKITAFFQASEKNRSAEFDFKNAPIFSWKLDRKGRLISVNHVVLGGTVQKICSFKIFKTLVHWFKQY